MMNNIKTCIKYISIISALNYCHYESNASLVMSNNYSYQGPNMMNSGYDDGAFNREAINQLREFYNFQKKLTHENTSQKKSTYENKEVVGKNDHILRDNTDQYRQFIDTNKNKVRQELSKNSNPINKTNDNQLQNLTDTDVVEQHVFWGIFNISKFGAVDGMLVSHFLDKRNSNGGIEKGEGVVIEKGICSQVDYNWAGISYKQGPLCTYVRILNLKTGNVDEYRMTRKIGYAFERDISEELIDNPNSEGWAKFLSRVDIKHVTHDDVDSRYIWSLKKNIYLSKNGEGNKPYDHSGNKNFIQRKSHLQKFLLENGLLKATEDRQQYQMSSVNDEGMGLSFSWINGYVIRDNLDNTFLENLLPVYISQLRLGQKLLKWTKGECTFDKEEVLFFNNVVNGMSSMAVDNLLKSKVVDRVYGIMKFIERNYNEPAYLNYIEGALLQKLGFNEKTLLSNNELNTPENWEKYDSEWKKLIDENRQYKGGKYNNKDGQEVIIYSLEQYKRIYSENCFAYSTKSGVRNRFEGGDTLVQGQDASLTVGSNGNIKLFGMHNTYPWTQFHVIKSEIIKDGDGKLHTRAVIRNDSIDKRFVWSYGDDDMIFKCKDGERLYDNDGALNFDALTLDRDALDERQKYMPSFEMDNGTIRINAGMKLKYDVVNQMQYLFFNICHGELDNTVLNVRVYQNGQIFFGYDTTTYTTDLIRNRTWHSCSSEVENMEDFMSRLYNTEMNYSTHANDATLMNRLKNALDAFLEKCREFIQSSLSNNKGLDDTYVWNDDDNNSNNPSV